jgi:hypothetical protein
MGCTLAAYAQAKRLPELFLRGLGVSEFYMGGVPALRMPYLTVGGEEGPVRFRTAVTGNESRFKWKTGSTPTLYGLSRLALARTAGYVVLVEGESDAQTLWFHEVPALGLPGAGSWREEWAAAFDGINCIYVIVEPDAGGEGVLTWLSKSSIRDRVRLVRLQGAKDPSELHVAEPDQFDVTFRAALDAAKPWSEHAKQADDDAEAAAWAECSHLAKRPRLLDDFLDAIEARGVVGEERVVQILFLAVVSRVFSRPVSVVVKGPSSAGKSHVTRQVLAFFPPSAFYELTGMSERAMVYSEEPLKHRMLSIGEATGLSGEMASMFVRTLLSEGFLRYETVVSTTSGLKPVVLTREGPTGLILTTTAIAVHPENETRLLSVSMNDTQEQTSRVLLAMASQTRPAPEGGMEVWRALHQWLAFGLHEVDIPFATALAEQTGTHAVRMRRDFGALLTLIRAHALLHRASRERDAEGRIVATLDDYAAVRELVDPTISANCKVHVTPAVRETVAAVGALDPTDHQPPSLAAVARHLKLDESAASRRVNSAVALGYLVNDEVRRERPPRLRLGGALPQERSVLPRVEDLVGAAPSVVQAHAAAGSDGSPQGAFSRPVSAGTLAAGQAAAPVAGQPAKDFVTEF